MEFKAVTVLALIVFLATVEVLAIPQLPNGSGMSDGSPASPRGSGFDSEPSRPTLFQFDPQRVVRGVATIMDGVRNGSLEQILRGSFTFPGSSNTRQIASGVLDAIFGRNNNGQNGGQQGRMGMVNQ